jgi:hypothetical protein
MIRFSCRKCGKSLRADDSIIGRSTRCTACQAINRIPPESTRKSGEKSVRILAEPVAAQPQTELYDEEIVTLVAESDSFEGFEDLDLSNLTIDTSQSKMHLDSAQTARPTFKIAAGDSVQNGQHSANKAVSGTASLEAAAIPAWKRAPRSISPFPFIVVGTILVLSGLGYFGYRMYFAAPAVVRKTELEKSSIGYKFEQTLFEFKKAQRVLEYMMRVNQEKKLPEANLTNAKELKRRSDALAAEGLEQLATANRLYSKDPDGAGQLLRDHVKLMTELQKEIQQENRRLEGLLK